MERPLMATLVAAPLPAGAPSSESRADELPCEGEICGYCNG